MIITIGRQFGSGGGMVGRLVAEKLGYKFYDSEILTIAAESSGLSPDAVSRFDERPGNSLIYSMYMSTIPTGDMLPINQQLAFAQFNAIRVAAREDNCVFIGRCADYVLRQRRDLMSLFVHADMESRKARVVAHPEIYHVAAENVERAIRKQDKQRADYYNFFTHGNWGAADNYHLALDSSYLGIEGMAEIVIHLVELKERQMREQ
jgi:cytidylate kinase